MSVIVLHNLGVFCRFSKESCPTIAAMLEGAVNDSIRFVDDLSTLLDPDNPRNWQGLAQSYFNMSFNKIKEIRYII